MLPQIGGKLALVLKKSQQLAWSESQLSFTVLLLKHKTGIGNRFRELLGQCMISDLVRFISFVFKAALATVSSSAHSWKILHESLSEFLCKSCALFTNVDA